jgi:integrase
VAKSVAFTIESLERAQRSLAEGRVEITDAKDSKLKARVSPSSIVLGTWRYERGTATWLPLGALSETFSISDARKQLAVVHQRPLAVVKARRTTFGDVAKAYYDDRLSRTKRGSDSWKHTYQLHVEPRLGRLPIAEVVPAVIRKAISEIAKPTPLENGRQSGGPGAARHALRFIRAVLSRALADRLVEYNAAASLPLKELGLSQKHRDRWLDARLAPRFFDTINLKTVLGRKALPDFSVTAQVRLAVAFLFYCPVRASSLTAARIEEFDLKPRVGTALWTVPASRIKGATQPQVLPLVGTALDIIKELLRLAENAKSPYLLPSPEDAKKPLAEKTTTQYIRRLERAGRIGPKAENGSERITLHTLRASWRSWALELGVGAEVAERVMGHRSALAQLGFSSAAQLYTRSPALQRQAEALKKVGEHLDLFWKPGKGGKLLALRSGPEEQQA